MPKLGMAPNNLEVAQVFFETLQDDLHGFSELSHLLKNIAGINLPVTAKNQCLMASRLGPILRARGFGSYQEYLHFLKKSGEIGIREFVATLTTHTTHFFRESKHFEVLKSRIPALLEKKSKLYQNEIRVWCCAASTGQEPYTILITLCEAIENLGSKWSIKFLATDIDMEVLGKASYGAYSESEMTSMPALYKQKYFESVPERKGSYRVKPQYIQMIQFAPFNLALEKYPFRFPFDIIFCRNVLIYFDTESSQKVVHKLANCLSVGGCLFLGHSESVAMRTNLLTQVAAATYLRAARSGSK